VLNFVYDLCVLDFIHNCVSLLNCDLWFLFVMGFLFVFIVFVFNSNVILICVTISWLCLWFQFSYVIMICVFDFVHTRCSYSCLQFCSCTWFLFFANNFNLVCFIFTLILFVSLGLCCLTNMTTSDKHNFVYIFNDKNYTTWKFQFKTYVKGKGLWDHLDGLSKPLTKQIVFDSWEVKYSYIISSILSNIQWSILYTLSQLLNKYWILFSTNL